MRLAPVQRSSVKYHRAFFIEDVDAKREARPPCRASYRYALPIANANTTAPPATTRTPAWAPCSSDMTPRTPGRAPCPRVTTPCTAAGASAGSANATSSFNGRRAVHERWQTAHSYRHCRIRLPGMSARQEDDYARQGEKHFSGHNFLLAFLLLWVFHHALGTGCV